MLSDSPVVLSHPRTVEIAMATMIIDCPSCGRKLRVPDELLGKAVKCPTCEHMFEAPTAQAQTTSPAVFPQAPNSAFSPPAAPHESAAPLGSEGQPTANQDTDFQRCPNCAERNDKDAAHCRFCGEALQHAEQEADRPGEQTHPPSVRRDAEPHHGPLILVLGIISIVMVMVCGLVGLPLGIAAWVMGRRDLLKMRQHVMDPEGAGLTQAGMICGIIGTILDSLWLVGCLIYLAFIFTFAAAGMRGMPPRPPAVPPPVRQMPVPAPAPAGNKAAVRVVVEPWLPG
jgi:predicted Zn finger-like uncharacterized protein